MPALSPADLAVPESAGVACFLCRLPTLPLVYFVSPYPPCPLPRRGRGRPRLFHARGFAPCIPAPEPEAALTEPAKQVPGGRNPRLPQKRQEAVPYEQCRQPRRGGTGGEELRRLRWSSPPGQGEQVPLGFSPAGRRQRPPRLQRRSNPPDTGAPPGAGKRQMPPKFCRNRLTSTAPIWYNTNNPAGCLPPEKEHGMP